MIYVPVKLHISYRIMILKFSFRKTCGYYDQWWIQGHRCQGMTLKAKFKAKDLFIKDKDKDKVKDIGLQRKPESLCRCSANLRTLYQRIWLTQKL